MDASDDLLRLRTALRYLPALKEDLKSVEVSSTNLHRKLAIVKQLYILEEIIANAMVQEVSFSMMKGDNLNNLGIAAKWLRFYPDKLSALVLNMDQKTKEQVELLKGQLIKLYDQVNLYHDSGRRMILDAVLLTLGNIVRDTQLPGLSVAILPEMSIGSLQSDVSGIRVKNPESEYELLLTGTMGYAVVRYRHHDDVKNSLLRNGDQTRGADFEFVNGGVYLVQAKSQSMIDNVVASCAPQAVGQAIAWAKLTRQTELHFVLSDGVTWIFYILVWHASDDRWTYYESAGHKLLLDVLETSDQAFFEIMQLVLEWFSPSSTQFYELTNLPMTIY